MAEMPGMEDRSGLDSDLVMNRCPATNRFGGGHMGLYRATRVGEAGMLVNHGGSAFPVEAAPETVPSHGYALVIGDALCGLRSARRPSDAGEM